MRKSRLLALNRQTVLFRDIAFEEVSVTSSLSTSAYCVKRAGLSILTKRRFGSFL